MFGPAERHVRAGGTKRLSAGPHEKNGIGDAMSDLNTQVKLRRLERKQVLDRRLAIAALVAAIVVGGVAFWNARDQYAQSRKAQARQGWSELMLRSDDEALSKAKKTLRAFVEQTKRMPDALRERNGMDAFVIRITTKCLALYVYATIVPVTGTTDDCPAKTAKPEDKEKYYSDVDVSRRLIKDLHEKLMLLDADGMIEEPVVRRFLRDSTVDFLTNVWLPVERGLNHVVEKDADTKDKSAQGLRDWTAERVKKIKAEPRASDQLPETSYY
jgi:hypothetical protein